MEMTERMENALNHIKTSVDVDTWAMEEVERVFNAVDDIKAEIQYEADNNANACDMKSYYHCLQIIDKYIGKENE